MLRISSFGVQISEVWVIEGLATVLADGAHRIICHAILVHEQGLITIIM